MRYFSHILVSVIATFVTSSSFADTSNTKGITTCYILKNDKVVQKSACSYHADFAISTTYSTSDYTYTVPHYGKIKTVTDNTDIISDDEGKVISSTMVYMVNGKPSTNFQRNPKTLKIYSEKELAKNSNLFKNSLYCNRTKDKKLEICTPDKGND